MVEEKPTIWLLVLSFHAEQITQGVDPLYYKFIQDHDNDERCRGQE
jgi:hypothetical protein